MVVKQMNIGCDIVENKRLENKSETFINKVLTEDEKVLYRKIIKGAK